MTETRVNVAWQEFSMNRPRVNAPLAEKMQKMGNDQHVKLFGRVRVLRDVINATPKRTERGMLFDIILR